MLASQPNNVPRLSLNPALHYGNAWRDARGKVLTNHAITKRMKEGWYGETAKRAALARTAVSKNGFVDRCKCGETLGVKFFDYKYLPEPGFLCPKCLETARGFRVRVKTAGMAKRDLNEFI